MRAKLVLALTAGLLVAADKDVTKKTDQDALQGTWEIVAAQRAGKPFDEPKGDKVVFAKDQITVKGKGGKEEKGVFKLDPNKKPKQIDLTPNDANEKPMQGIYELKGDTLKICIGRPGGERPKELKTVEGVESVLIELKREKK